MDIIIMLITATIVLGFLVFIHEGGHYLASRAFGVRVTEFMLGLPGPSIGFTRAGTRFGITCVPLGGYARVCGMEAGNMKPYLKEVLGALYKRGTATMEDIAADLNIKVEEAEEALDELVEWGSVVAPLKQDKYNTYRTPKVVASKKQPESYEMGAPRAIENLDEFFESEYKQQYRSLPFWKRSVILVAGIAMNLIFAMLAFVLIYSIFGFDMANEDGTVTHIVVDPLRSIQAGFAYIGMVFQAIISLFNPATAADTVSNSTSIMGIAVMSKSAFEQGIISFLSFTAMISVSLGLMNLLPIPPLDGGRFLVEIIQKLSRRNVSQKIMNGISYAGVALFMGFFLVMLNQDIQRFIFGNWG